MSKIKSIRKVKNLESKKILLRLDNNVPVQNGKIKDDFKITASLPSLRYLMRYKAKIIIITHLGRPQKSKNKKLLTTETIAKNLSKKLNKKVFFVKDCIGARAESAISKLNPGEIIVLENLRFYKEEKKNDQGFAKNLASLADIYVNDAFAVSHRKHASVCAIKKYLPAYAGILLEQEVNNLNKIKNPIKPLVSIIGGAKIETKLPLIKNLLKNSEKILIGGALANNFFAAKNLEIGKSIVDDNGIKLAKKIYTNKILLPVDVLVSNKKDGSGYLKVKNPYEVNKNEIILDIGPETIRLYSTYIKKANTIIWNGPMGFFEADRFKHGTLGIARLVAARSSGRAFAAVGGGETIEALKMSKMIEYIDWVSTGGGAMLSYLGDEKMPGFEKIIK